MLPLPTLRIHPTAALRCTAMLALAIGVGVWGALLLAPSPARLPPGLTTPPPARGDVAPLANWFGASAAPIKVIVVGLIAAGPQGAAILRVEGGAPQAYKVGQTLAQGVKLASVQRDGVVLDSGGTALRVAAPDLPALGSPGFVIRPR